jgi:hypothetical protein
MHEFDGRETTLDTLEEKGSFPRHRVTQKVEVLISRTVDL